MAQKTWYLIIKVGTQYSFTAAWLAVTPLFGLFPFNYMHYNRYNYMTELIELSC